MTWYRSKKYAEKEWARTGGSEKGCNWTKTGITGDWDGSCGGAMKELARAKKKDAVRRSRLDIRAGAKGGGESKEWTP